MKTDMKQVPGACFTATVFSNEREIYEDGKVTYMPVYLVMFIKADNPQVDDTEYLF